MDGARVLWRTLIVMLLLGLLASTELVVVLYRNPFSVLGLIVFMHTSLLVTALVALYLERSWGFYLVYVAVPSRRATVPRSGLGTR